MHDSARLFSRLQSTQNPSPSGEGRSIAGTPLGLRTLAGEIGPRCRNRIREICRSEDIEVLEGHVRPDHVHQLLSARPTCRVTEAMLKSTLLDDVR